MDLSQEVHQRVKNNLALVSRLLKHECDKREMNQEYEKLLMHTNLKVQTISVIHELLYQQHSHAQVDLDRFLKEFKERIIGTLIENDEMPIDLQFDNEGSVNVDIKYAVPIALFLYECVIFAKRSDVEPISRLFIDVYKTDSNLYLSFHCQSDYEVPVIDLEEPSRLELQLVQALIMQLDAVWKVEYDESEAVIYLDIPIRENEE